MLMLVLKFRLQHLVQVGGVPLNLQLGVLGPQRPITTQFSRLPDRLLAGEVETRVLFDAPIELSTGTFRFFTLCIGKGIIICQSSHSWIKLALDE